MASRKSFHSSLARQKSYRNSGSGKTSGAPPRVCWINPLNSYIHKYTRMIAYITLFMSAHCSTLFLAWHLGLNKNINNIGINQSNPCQRSRRDTLEYQLSSKLRYERALVRVNLEAMICHINFENLDGSKSLQYLNSMPYISFGRSHFSTGMSRRDGEREALIDLT